MTVWVFVVARALLVAMFPFSAVDKVWHWDNSIAQTEGGPVPRVLVRPMLVAAIVVEFVTPIMIVSGVWDRLGAFLLAGFCAVTAFLYHPFWQYPDFFVAEDTSKAREHFWQFWKNFCIVGGLMLVMFGGPLASPREVVRHPLSSTVTP